MCLTIGCSDGVIRLVGGITEHQGRVEICIGGEWGSVCDDLWDSNDAQVVCRQLGYSVSGAMAVHRAASIYGQASGSILISDVRCSGSESRLIDCSRIDHHECTENLEEAGVMCQGKYANHLKRIRT